MAALVEATDVFCIQALVFDLHPSAEGTNWRKILNREADRFSGRREMTSYESGTRSTPALCHEQCGWLSVVEGHDLFVQKRALGLLQRDFLIVVSEQLDAAVSRLGRADVCFGIARSPEEHARSSVAVLVAQSVCPRTIN